MTYQEIAVHIRNLPLHERLELLDVLTRSLKEELEPSALRQSSLNRIRGIGKPDGRAPTDQEIRDDYTDFLARKYS